MPLDERLQVDIAPGDGARLEIQRHETTDHTGFLRQPLIPVATPHVYLRLYPAVLATLRATVGAVSQHGVRQERIENETVLFEGAQTARTEHRASADLVLSVAGLAFDENGDAVNVSVTADDTGALRATRPFYGAAVVSYTTEYRLLRYDFAVTEQANGLRDLAAGAVLAFYGGEVATYQVALPDLDDSNAGTNQAEYFRDVSYTILQGAEEYERPPGWPEYTWSGLSLVPAAAATNPAPDPDEGWIEHERVHEIGLINSACFLSTDSYPVRPAKPWQGSTNYDIPIERKMASSEALAGFSDSCITRAQDQLQEQGS